VARTEVYFWQDENGHAPVQLALQELRQQDPEAYAKSRVRLERLEALGHELRRPEADHLEDGIYELRVRRGNVQYRTLYFFQARKRNIVILAHFIQKEGSAVPPAELKRAKQRRDAFEASPDRHTRQGDWREEVPRES